jgi:predicted phosphodiesterase
MRIAVLADIHGNLPALRAVLRELDADGYDAIVVAGDVVAGPLVRQPLELLASRPEPVHWLRGNCEREAVAAFDGVAQADDPAGRGAAWSARALDRRWRDELARWPIARSLDGACFCHGSPSSDEELITRRTPDEVLLELLSGVSERLVVGGHTHQQMVRRLHDGLTYANAGSVGLPYEGRAGAFWMTVDGGVPLPRETSYDLDGALAELRASGYPGLDELLKESLVEPVDPDEVSAFFERAAGR